MEGDDDPASGLSSTTTTSSSSSSSGSLLPRLLEANTRHRQRHDREADKIENDDGAGGGIVGVVVLRRAIVLREGIAKDGG